MGFCRQQQKVTREKTLQHFTENMTSTTFSYNKLLGLSTTYWASRCHYCHFLSPSLYSMSGALVWEHSRGWTNPFKADEKQKWEGRWHLMSSAFSFLLFCLVKQLLAHAPIFTLAKTNRESLRSLAGLQSRWAQSPTSHGCPTREQKKSEICALHHCVIHKFRPVWPGKLQVYEQNS